MTSPQIVIVPRVRSTASEQSGGHGTRTRNPLRRTTFPVVTPVVTTPNVAKRFGARNSSGAISGAVEFAAICTGLPRFATKQARLKAQRRRGPANRRHALPPIGSYLTVQFAHTTSIAARFHFCTAP
jgi:hypothetical protein